MAALEEVGFSSMLKKTKQNREELCMITLIIRVRKLIREFSVREWIVKKCHVSSLHYLRSEPISVLMSKTIQSRQQRTADISGQKVKTTEEWGSVDAIKMLQAKEQDTHLLDSSFELPLLTDKRPRSGFH